jgi:hypothetical protein
MTYHISKCYQRILINSNIPLKNVCRWALFILKANISNGKQGMIVLPINNNAPILVTFSMHFVSFT